MKALYILSHIQVYDCASKHLMPNVKEPEVNQDYLYLI